VRKNALVSSVNLAVETKFAYYRRPADTSTILFNGV